MAIIATKLASFDDQRVLAVAGIVQSMDDAEGTLRQLSARKSALLEQSKQDFSNGQTYSHAELTAMLDERLALRGVPKATA